MKNPTVEFLFDVGSPTSYLAYHQLPKVAQRTGATIVWTPVALGALLRSSGNISPAEVSAKATWMFGDLERWARHYGMRFQLNPHFPLNTLLLMRGAVACQETGELEPYLDAVFDGIWVDGRNLSEPAELGEVLDRAGLDFERIKSAALSEPVKARLKANTERAVERGVFGCPSFFVGKHLFFGQDRLHFVEESLRDDEANRE